MRPVSRRLRTDAASPMTRDTGSAFGDGSSVAAKQLVAAISHAPAARSAAPETEPT